MHLNFYPKITDDGSLGLYNTEVDDIYHSSYGAYSEAIEKFIKPSGLQNYVRNHSKVRILDICSGMCYNLKAAIDEIIKINPDCCIEIDCLEIDSYVFGFGLLYKVEQIDYDVHYFLLESFLSNSQIIKSMVELIENDKIFPFLDEKLALFFVSKIHEKIDFMTEYENNSKIHNIYYKYKSNRYKNPPKKLLKFPDNKLQVFFENARVVVKNLKEPYNFVFHDGFTPSKQSVLWSIQFFRHLKRLLCEDGNITTYSSSAPVRAAMIQNGLFLSKIYSENRKTSGTVASLSKNFCNIPLSEEEFGLLNTKAGIVYRDEDLCLSHNEIISNREKEVLNSSLCSSSSYLKKNKKG